MSDTTPLVSDQEMQFWIGLDIYQTIVGLFVESVSWGCYALLFAFAVYIQYSNGLKSLRSQIMLSVTCLLFLTSTTLLSLDVTWLLRNKIRKTLMINSDEPLFDKYSTSASEVPKFGTPSEALFMLNMLVGDSVVIWRAHVIWERRIIMILVPVICLLASLGFAIADVICLTASSNHEVSTIPIGSKACVWAEPISWALSLLTNIISTSLIALKAWLFRRSMQQILGESKPPITRAQRVLVLLIESGFIYCLFWIGEIVLFFPIESTSNVMYVWEFFAGIGNQISGMYPTAIIVLVSLQKSFVEMTMNQMPQAQKVLDVEVSQIRFAHSVSTATTNTTPGTLDTVSTQVETKGHGMI